eukprot:840721-Pyramimonas_sp.AAC.1
MFDPSYRGIVVILTLLSVAGARSFRASVDQQLLAATLVGLEMSCSHRHASGTLLGPCGPPGALLSASWGGDGVLLGLWGSPGQSWDPFWGVVSRDLLGARWVVCRRYERPLGSHWALS